MDALLLLYILSSKRAPAEQARIIAMMLSSGYRGEDVVFA
jgi:hypothetical protein